MKKSTLIVAVIGLVSLTACKKDYVCECTETSTTINNSGSDVETSTYKTEYKGVTKRWINNTGACLSSEVTYSEPGEIGSTTYKSDCALSK